LKLKQESIDLFQVERYLIDSDLLIIIRVPTEELIPIHSSQIKSELIKSISTLTRKTQRLIDNDTMRVQGEWCRGCTAACEHRKSKWNNIHAASIGGFEQLMKNVVKRNKGRQCASTTCNCQFCQSQRQSSLQRKQAVDTQLRKAIDSFHQSARQNYINRETEYQKTVRLLDLCNRHKEKEGS